MIKFLKQLFCRYKWGYSYTDYRAVYYINADVYDVYKCSKCGDTKFKTKK